MVRVNLDEPRSRLLELVDAAFGGERVIIGKDDEQLVQLVPVASTKKQRQFGSAKGLIKMAEDFDALLSDFDEYAL